MLELKYFSFQAFGDLAYHQSGEEPYSFFREHPPEHGGIGKTFKAAVAEII